MRMGGNVGAKNVEEVLEPVVFFFRMTPLGFSSKHPRLTCLLVNGYYYRQIEGIENIDGKEEPESCEVNLHMI
jgi:hypothetical protein